MAGGLRHVLTENRANNIWNHFVSPSVPLIPQSLVWVHSVNERGGGYTCTVYDNVLCIQQE